MNTFGKKSIMSGLGKKAKDVLIKGVKVAGLVGLGGAALVGAAQSISDSSNPDVRMVRSQSSMSRALLGTK